MKVALSQINPVVGHLSANAKKICSSILMIQQAHPKTDLIVFPELALTGYPPTDQIFTDDFFKSQEAQLLCIEKVSVGVHVILGMMRKEGLKVYNVALWLDRSGGRTYQKKILLPNRDVFDEKRYFASGTSQDIWEIEGERIGLNICEDLWAPLFPEHETDPVELQIAQKSTLLINMSASPFVAGKDKIRKNLVRSHVKKAGVPFLYANLVGGNDDLIFDGGSFVIDAQGTLVAQAQSCVEDMVVIDTLNMQDGRISTYPDPDLVQKKDALILGLRDFVHKCGFEHVVLGLSGGIDSAVVAALAVAALGPEHVITVFMPTEFTRDISGEDAKLLAQRLGTQYLEIPINSAKDQLKSVLNQHLASPISSLTFENIQARLRGQVLMAISAEQRALVLQTGNKSEIALGYCTLYGDMAGALSPIGDLYKHEVYGLGKLLNQAHDAIPDRVFNRAPSAELKPNQEDADTLPPYDILDAIVKALIEEGATLQALINAGHDAQLIEDLSQKIKTQEFKRKQAPPILKTSAKAFGPGRRMAIATQEVM